MILPFYLIWKTLFIPMYKDFFILKLIYVAGKVEITKGYCDLWIFNSATPAFQMIKIVDIISFLARSFDKTLFPVINIQEFRNNLGIIIIYGLIIIQCRRINICYQNIMITINSTILFNKTLHPRVNWYNQIIFFYIWRIGSSIIWSSLILSTRSQIISIHFRWAYNSKSLEIRKCLCSVQ